MPSWNLPDVPSALGRVGAVPAERLAALRRADGGVGATVNDNQPGGRYDLTYNYQNNGTTMNLTGSPDYAARIVYVGDPGSGCSSDQYRQFNTAAVTGPTYSSVGLESGRNILGGCPDKTRRSGDCAGHPSGRQPDAAVPPRRVQRLQHRRHQQPSAERDLPEPDRPDDHQLAVPVRTARSIRHGCSLVTPGSARPPARRTCATCSCRFGLGSRESGSRK